MKTLNRIVRAVLFTVIAGAGATSSARAAAAIDFSAFEGKYTGTWFLSTGSITAPASVTVNVRTNKPGDEMTVEISGIGSVSGTAFPIAATYKFKSKKHKLIASSPLLGFVGPTATSPAKFKGAKNKFTFTTVAAPGASLLGFSVAGSFATLTTKFSKTNLTVSGTGVLVQSGISPQAVQFLVTLSKKKSGK